MNSDTLKAWFDRAWYDVKADRALGTTYTNPYAYPIELHISIDHPNGTAARQARLVVGGVVVYDSYIQATTNNIRAILPIQATVPPGATYVLTAVTGSPSIFRWAELY